MININLDGLVVTVEAPALACDCTHDSCFVRQNDPSHYEECDCPKVEGLLAVSVSPIHNNSWDSVLWAHVSKDELLEELDQFRLAIDTNFE